ncbi:DUF2169 family type VI secretion system accessory protein [Sorangium sp. So ce394]|uniref:DUF2169 family type VI secretion system accessory protein n=1 Tax=Sorangium sp. So ce394 TaxID=3133310 RepID=UPI003F5AFD35
MDVVSLCPLPASGFVWQSQDGRAAQTVVAKATFVLVPGRSYLAAEQQAPNEEDKHWNDDPARSVVAPSDRVPYKPRADVMLVGHAYAPGKRPMRSMMVRVAVGDIDKSIEVWCDRAFRVRDGQLLEGQGFTKMPLCWERAAGGPDTSNPVGVRFDAPPDMYGRVTVPNLQPPGMHVVNPSDTFAPVCFAPIGRSWPGRTSWLGHLAGKFPQPGWEERPLPEGLDPVYFLAAPLDQQVEQIRPNEHIILENLSPDHARLVTNLPGVRPRAVAHRATGEHEEVALVADTLWIDADRGLCTVVWRGRIGLRHPNEAGRITVTLEGDAGGRVSGDEAKPSPPEARGAAEKRGVEEDAEGTLQLGDKVSAAVAPVMPFQGGGEPRQAPAPPASRPGDAALPFRPGGPPPHTAEPAPPPAPPAVSPAPPPLVVLPPPAEPIARPATAGPWSRLEAGGRPSIGQSVVESMAGSSPGSRSPASPPAEPTPAAAAPAPAPAPRRSGREIVDLLWFSPAAMPRIRKHPAWKEILADVKPRPDDEELDDDMPPGKRPSAKDRRDVLAILARGQPMRVEDLEQAMMEAVGEDGAFVPPLVLVAGELELPFDEVETLKALVAAASPLVMADKKLKETVEAIHDVFKMPWVQGATSVVEGLTGQLREALGQNRVVPARTIEAHAERALLEHRHFQKRLVMGQMRLRALLSSTGGHVKVPVYWPEAVGKELPGLQRMQVRMIAALGMRTEHQESAGVALRACSVARRGAL